MTAIDKTNTSQQVDSLSVKKKKLNILALNCSIFAK